MLKKILIIILIAFVLITIGLFVWAFSISKNSGGEMTVRESFREIVSFGESQDNIFSRIDKSETFEVDFLANDNLEEDIDINALLLREVAPFPIVGMSVVKNEDGEIRVKFIAKENGHIFESSTVSSAKKKISNTTILGIKEAIWLQDGAEFIARFLDRGSSEIESFYAKIKTQDETDTVGSLEGVFLPKNIKELAIQSDKNKIFYLLQSGDGSIGIVSNPDGDGKIQMFESPLSEWTVQWPNGKKIVLTTKASSDIAGYLYLLDTDTQKLEKLLSGMDGLTTLADKSGKKILFTHKDIGRFFLSVFDTNSGKITDLPVWTFSEKCVWSEKNQDIIYCGIPDFAPEGDELDLWYQGLVSFRDSVWMIDIETQTAKIIIEPFETVGKEIDIIKPTLSPDEDYLFFMNKTDSHLWQLKI